jgi:hypothetical protein
MSQATISSDRCARDEPQGKSPEHQARGLLQALGLVRRCQRLRAATEAERAQWAAEEQRLLRELRSFQAGGVDLSRLPGGEEFAAGPRVGAANAGEQGPIGSSSSGTAIRGT